jgi:hypothetical protein
MHRRCGCGGSFVGCPSDPAWPAIAHRQRFAIPRHMAPGFCFVEPFEMEGRREGRAPAGTRKTPVRECVISRSQGRNRCGRMPGLPCAMVETAYVALSPVRRFPVATVALQLSSDAPSGRTIAPLQDLTPECRASRPHDFAVREAAPSYTRPLIAHGDYPPCDRIWRRRRPRPPPLTPRTLTIAIRPLPWAELERIIRCVVVRVKRNFD